MSEVTEQLDIAPIPKKAAIIDDAFDDVVQGEITLLSFQEFYQIADEEGTLTTVLERLNITIPVVSALEEDSDEFLNFLKALWHHKDDEELKPIINTEKLFADKFGKLIQLESLCSNIEQQNITVERFKSKVDDLSVFEKGEYVYIFIDYYLGVIADADAIKNAQKTVKDIYRKCPSDQKPVTILMSSTPNIENKKEEFQQEADMLEGVFRFSYKKDLEDSGKVSLLVRAYGEEFYSNHALQEYIHSLITAGAEAQTAFTAEVKTLRIEDYEFMQHSVLQEQQQPLGDYLAWLYGTHWANLLLKNEDLKQKQKEIDTIMSKKPPLHHSLPSIKLSEIFMSALFEDQLDEIRHHPWEEQEENVASLPYLHLGDVFTKEGDKKLFMVLNPQCDLERPDCKSSNLSIFLTPGEMESLDHLPKQSLVKTDFFIFEDNQYRIYWDLKRVTTVALKDFDKWLEDNSYSRKYRLRLPFALDIQQQFSSNISRVGLPVSPPLSRHIPLKISYKRYDEKVIDDFITKSDSYAFQPITRSAKQEIKLTLSFALDFKSALQEESTTLQKARQELGEDAPQALNKAISKIDAIIGKFDDWYFKNRGFTWPTKAVKILENDFLSVTLDQADYVATTPFSIDISTKGTRIVEIEETPVQKEEDKKEHTTEVLSSDNLSLNSQEPDTSLSERASKPD